MSEPTTTDVLAEDALTLAHWAAKTTKRRPRELAVSRVGVVM